MLFRTLSISLLLGCLVAPAFAQPRVDALQNNYSFLVPGDPNYGIARGSIFVIYGQNLANTSTGLQSATTPPFLQTTLEGVSAQVTVNGVTTDVIWYYVTPNQCAGILPSSTPAGDGTIVLRNNGQASNAAPIHVVDSAFGVLSLNGTGSGAAAVYDTQYRFLGPENSAKPGDAIQLFGTGLGPTTGSEVMQETPVDLTSIPISVEIAGAPATVLFRGRIFPGLDQINVLIPNAPPAAAKQQGASMFGCAVAITVKIGAYASNVTTIPIAQNGGACTPAGGGGGGGGGQGSTSDLSISQAEIDRWVAAGGYRVGGVGLTRQTSYAISDDPVTGATSTMVTTSDVLSATFYSVVGSDLAKLLNPSAAGPFTPVAGNCAVTQGIPTNAYPNLVYTSLDAGSNVAVEGPGGVRTAPRTVESGFISYSATIGSGVGSDYLAPGTYRVSGPGGPDVGAFSGDLNIAPELVWTNHADAAVIDRSKPFTVTWTGGEPTTLVSIQGTSSTFSSTGVVTTASFTCWANNPDGRFTVPASVLSQLPASGRISAGTISILQRGTLGVASVGTGVRMFADGIDYLTGGNQWGTGTTPEYK
ncbi:MAG: hypothetical protein R2748_21140 [Bryobacterales bacterium]